MTKQPPLAALGKAKRVLGVIGTQARLAPQAQYLKQPVADRFYRRGAFDELIARGGQGGGIVPDKTNDTYMLKDAEGASYADDPGREDACGTSGSAEKDCAVLGGAGCEEGREAPCYCARLGAGQRRLRKRRPVVIHYRGSTARDGDVVVWDTEGTEGDVRLKRPLGHPHLVPVTFRTARGDGKAFKPLQVPACDLAGPPPEPLPNNVARSYSRLARGLREGKRTAPTLDDVAVHRVVAAIEKAAAGDRGATA